MTTRRFTTRRSALLRVGTAALSAASLPTLAAVGGLPSAEHGDSSPEWDRLAAQLFPGRRIEAGRGVVQLIAPLRAAYGASVPIKIVSKLAQAPALHVRRMHLVHEPLADEPLAIVRAVRELQADPLRHLNGVGVDRSRRSRIVDVAPRPERAERIVDERVRRRDIGPSRQGAYARGRRAHAERREDSIANEVVPCGILDVGNDLSRGDVHDVLVAELAAEAPAGLEKAHAPHDLVTVEAGAVPGQLAAREPTAVAEEVADRQLV